MTGHPLHLIFLHQIRASIQNPTEYSPVVFRILVPTKITECCQARVRDWFIDAVALVGKQLLQLVHVFLHFVLFVRVFVYEEDALLD